MFLTVLLIMIGVLWVGLICVGFIFLFYPDLRSAPGCFSNDDFPLTWMD